MVVTKKWVHTKKLVDMADEETAIVKATTGRGKYLKADFKELLKLLPEEVQAEIRTMALERLQDERLGGTWDESSTLVDIAMLEYIRNQVFNRIKDGEAYGGKGGDALNKFFIRVLDTLDKKKAHLLPLKPTVHIEAKLGEEVVKEVLIGKGIVRGNKVIEAEYEKEEGE